jgi:hypothetical protein
MSCDGDVRYNQSILHRDILAHRPTRARPEETEQAGELDSPTFQETYEWTNGVSLLDLPIELFEEVLFYCIRSTLVSLCHVSRFLHDIATRGLYRIVRWTDSRQAAMCAHTLLRNEVKARAVKVLIISRQ